MKLSIMLIATMFITALLLTSCDKDQNPVQSDYVEPLDSSLLQEASLMSLWYGDSRFADSALTMKFYYPLKNLRETYGDSINYVSQYRFTYPFGDGRVYLRLSDSRLEELQNETFYELDSLNEYFFVSGIDTNTSPYGDDNAIYLHFDTLQNPLYLSNEYRKIDGVLSSNPGGYITDQPGIYPWIVDDRVIFLVRYAYGDCVAGCVYSEFYYFKENGSGIDYIGWTNNVNDVDWWNEASPGYVKYRFPFL